ncbi:MAG: cytochrome C assembly protein [Desulfitibacter sp. BRH_c19]|nr:MAG: cytochrome C assembly protein [Desulfitibacter sp. BRH_c19]
MDKKLRILIFVGMALAITTVFLYAPEERVMGPIQKIFYFHVASAWTGFFAFFVVFLSSMLFLITKDSKFDRVAASSAELGTLFITIVLLTGPIWARVAWGTWWTWEPKLTTTLILWFIYIAYLVVRSSATNETGKQSIAAIFGIVGFLNVPLVYFSVEWWGRRLHPPIVTGGGLTGEMVFTLVFTLVSFSLLYFYMLKQSYDLLQIKDTLAIRKREAINLITWE